MSVMAAASPAFRLSSPMLISPLTTCSQALRPGRSGWIASTLGIQLGGPDFRILHQPHFIVARLGRGDAGELVGAPLPASIVFCS